MKRRTVGVLSVTVALMLAGASAPAFAAESRGDDQDPLITAMLEEVPGGVVIDETHVVWPRLDMALIVRTGPSPRAVGTCATGKICAYTAGSLGGSSLSFGTCGAHAIPASFIARSLANARSSGSVQARNASTVVATVYAGNSTNLAGTVTNLRCVL